MRPSELDAYLTATQPRPLKLPELSRWHVTTQDRLLFHLHAIWGGKRPRTMIDLGSHASFGHFINMSDALFFLGFFGNIQGSAVVAVDAFEDFALDLQRRFDAIEPFASMVASKLSLARAITSEDGRRVSFHTAARMHASCCADHWCHYGRMERERKADHLCRITRMRLGLLPSEGWLAAYPSSYPTETIRQLADPNASLPAYRVPSITLQSLFKAPPLTGRRLDVLKVDIDANWKNLGGLEVLLEEQQLGVAVMEVDGSWGGMKMLPGPGRWNVSSLDQLAWLARSHGYNSYLKVPCKVWCPLRACVLCVPDMPYACSRSENSSSRPLIAISHPCPVHRRSVAVPAVVLSSKGHGRGTLRGASIILERAH